MCAASALLREGRTTLTAAQRVECRVDGDAVQPREEIGPAIERREGTERLHERLLRRVVGITVVAEDMECGGVHAALMTANQSTESFSITIASPIQVGILVTHCWAL